MILFNGCVVSNALSIKLKLLFGSGKWFRMGWDLSSRVKGQGSRSRVKGSRFPGEVSCLVLICLSGGPPISVYVAYCRWERLSHKIVRPSKKTLSIDQSKDQSMPIPEDLSCNCLCNRTRFTFLSHQPLTGATPPSYYPWGGDFNKALARYACLLLWLIWLIRLTATAYCYSTSTNTTALAIQSIISIQFKPFPIPIVWVSQVHGYWLND